MELSKQYNSLNIEGGKRRRVSSLRFQDEESCEGVKKRKVPEFTHAMQIYCMKYLS